MQQSRRGSTLSSEAYAIVRRKILRGDLPMGAIISRRRVADELGMSFLPVTEALLRLEHEGLLESRPRAATRVRMPSREEVIGHYVVREALEVQAVLLYMKHATSAERTKLTQLAERVDALSKETDRQGYIDLHQSLHRRIAEYARCKALSEAIEKTHALASIWFCSARRSGERGPSHRHRDLIVTLNCGDAARATDAIREHIAGGLRHALQTLEPYFRRREIKGRFVRGPQRKKASKAIRPRMFQ